MGRIAELAIPACASRIECSPALHDIPEYLFTPKAVGLLPKDIATAIHFYNEGIEILLANQYETDHHWSE